MVTWTQLGPKLCQSRREAYPGLFSVGFRSDFDCVCHVSPPLNNFAIAAAAVVSAFLVRLAYNGPGIGGK